MEIMIYLTARDHLRLVTDPVASHRAAVDR